MAVAWQNRFRDQTNNNAFVLWYSHVLAFYNARFRLCQLPTFRQP